MPAPIPPSRRRQIIAAILLVVNPLLYLVSEAVSAAAWRNPTYDYAVNVISDLGVPSYDGKAGFPDGSPLFWVMNTTFIIHGILFIIAAIMLAPVFTQRRARAFAILAVAHGVGIALVGLFPGSPASMIDGTVVWHTLGAMLAIFGGNIAMMIAGVGLRRTGRGLGTALVVLGIVGILSAVVMFGYFFVTAGAAAIPERIAVYMIILGELVAGVVLLVAQRRNAHSSSSSQGASAASTRR